MRKAFYLVIPVVALLTLSMGLGSVVQEPKKESEASKLSQKDQKESEKPKLSEQEIQVLKDRLKLTEEQTPKVVALLEEDLAVRQEIRSKYDKEQADSKAMRDELQKSRQQLFNKLGDVLSSEQVSEYRKFLGERRKERREKRKAKPDQPD